MWLMHIEKLDYFGLVLICFEYVHYCLSMITVVLDSSNDNYFPLWCFMCVDIVVYSKIHSL